MSRANPTKKRLGEVLILAFLVLDFAGCESFRAARLYNEGTAALNQGEFEIAISRLNRAGELAPRASEIQNHLGLAFASTGQHEQALSAFEKAVDLDCSNAAAAHNLAAERVSIESELKTGLKTDTFSEQVP